MRPSPSAVTTDFTYQIPAALEGRMRRCRASVRAAIRAQLEEIAASAGKGRPAKALDRKGPPPRFYVYEGYRVVYELDAVSRSVVVLDVEQLPLD